MTNRKKLQFTDALLLLALLFSGFSALGYEIVWTRLLVLSLGSEHIAILGVLGGYFLGLCLGAFLFHNRVRYTRSPALWYCAFECVAALYACASPFLLKWLSGRMPMWLAPLMESGITVSLTISLLIAGAVLLPATICLGATLPALVEARRRAMSHAESGGRGMGRLYGANTLGATAGVFITVYFLLPGIGMLGSVLTTALAGFAAAVIVFYWDRLKNPSLAEKKEAASLEPTVQPDSESGTSIYILLFLTGFTGMAFEVAGVRILSQDFSNSIYAFANILGVYLTGTAAGAWLYSYLIARFNIPALSMTRALAMGLALSTLAASFVLKLEPQIMVRLTPPWVSFAESIRAEMYIAAAVFLIPTLLMGALFSHLTGRLTRSGVGRAIGVNMLGGALAPMVFGLFITGVFGYTVSFYLVPALYACIFLLAAPVRSLKTMPVLAGLGVLVLLALAAPRDLSHIHVPKNMRVKQNWEGTMGHVSVLEKTNLPPGAPPYRNLVVNKFHLMGGGNGYSERRSGHTGILLSPRKGRALFLGLGTGGSMSAALAYDFEVIEGIEIIPEVIEALPLFAGINEKVYQDPRARIICADARRYIMAAGGHYELIVADLYHPDAAGVSNLYSATHFSAIKKRLSPDGLFVQYVPVYQINERTLKAILRTFLSVFPRAYCFAGHAGTQAPLVLLGLKGDDDLYRTSLSSLDSVITGNESIRPFIKSADDFFGLYITGPDRIKAYSGKGPLNTDLNPLIMFEGPTYVYAKKKANVLRNLAMVKSHSGPLPKALIKPLTTYQDTTLWFFADLQREALTYWHSAEYQAVPFPPQERPRASVEMTLKAYHTHPRYILDRGMPYTLRPVWPIYGKLIFESMLERTPDLSWLRKEYEKFLGGQ